MHGAGFEIESTPATAGNRRIAVRGELDLATIDGLRAELDAALDAGEGIVLALDECTFLDSSALKTITDANRAAHEAGSDFALERPSAHVARVLELSGIDSVVTIHGG